LSNHDVKGLDDMMKWSAHIVQCAPGVVKLSELIRRVFIKLLQGAQESIFVYLTVRVSFISLSGLRSAS
jgi:hypothetical protein